MRLVTMRCSLALSIGALSCISCGVANPPPPSGEAGRAGVAQAPSHRAPDARAADVLAALRAGSAPETVLVVQRTECAIPSTLDAPLRVHLGDITGGQVLTTIRTAEGGTVVPLRALRVGDVAEFDWEGERYAVGISRMVNYLIGDDYAEVEFGTPTTVGAGQIAALLERIESSPLTFERNGEVHTGAEAADHLRKKMAGLGGRAIESGADFIDRVATSSSTTGEAYLVHIHKGHAVSLAGWLRGSLADAERGR